ncbi:MAG: antibiotic biosynthesis monooxygenase family protein, partial [Acidimicrobiales bacterium]
MILEHVVLDVDRDSIEQFESTFSRAKVIIAAAEGFDSLRLERCIEARGRYVLLVQW